MALRIPTSRDVSYANPRSGRIAPSGPTPMLGAATAAAGQAVAQAGYNLLDLAAKERVELENNRSSEVSTSLTRFLADEEQRFIDARSKSSESGIGFTRQFMESHQQRANDFAKSNFKGLDKSAQANYVNNIISRGNSLYAKATEFEDETKAAYYDRSTNENLSTYRTQIQNNAASFDELKRQGLESIEAVNMPEPWKAERRQKWEADAAESKWRWKFKENAPEALAQISSPVGGNTGRAYQRLISKGWTPAQAAGIVGNLSAESGLNTQARNPGDGQDGSDSIGVAQWNGGRARALKQFAAARGTDWHDLDTQIDFLDHELRTSERGAGETLARATNAEEAAAAFVGYERPAGWTPGNARGAMHWDKRRDAALRIAGQNPQAEDADLDAIPYERREQLAAWGESQYSQQVTKQRAAIKDSYTLDIATQPQQVRESNILNNPLLDDGDKAALVTSLRTALKETAGVDAMIKAMASGSVSVNPFDSEQKKVADLTFDKLVTGAADDGEKQAVTSDFVTRTGYIPKAVVAEVRRGAASTDAAMMSQAMEAGLVLNQQAPASFSAFEGSEAIRNKMELYRSYTRDMGYTPDEAARKLIRANDPELASRRESLLKSKTVADAVKKIDSATIAASFDTSRLGLSRNPVLGPTPAAEASMVAEYRSIFEEALVDAEGDMTAATKAATERFQRSYGVSTLSTLGGNVVVKNPPEKVYPAGPDGTHDYVKEQLAEAMKGQGIEADDFFLNPDIETDRDIKAGRPARYRVFYEKDGVLEQYNFPFAADPAEANQRFKANKTEERQQSEQRSIDNRTRSQAERKAVDDALSETVGPDWMKARAAEGEMERLRMDETMKGLSGEVNPGPLSGGER